MEYLHRRAIADKQHEIALIEIAIDELQINPSVRTNLFIQKRRIEIEMLKLDIAEIKTYLRTPSSCETEEVA